MNRRAAIIIGVSTSAGLEPLRSAGPSAEAVGLWLGDLDPGYDVTVITDEGSAVTRKQIYDAISDVLTPTRYELLLVYYIGHGLYHERSDVWMLSGLPEDPAECVNFQTSRDDAKFCGIRNVVFVSDACRSLPDKIGLARAQPTTVFPYLDRFGKATSKIDYFCATAEGFPAFEGIIDDKRQSFLTYALRRAFKSPSSSMTRDLEHEGKPIKVVPNRALEGFLQNTIDEKLGAEDFTKTQRIEANVPSADNVFIAPIDPPSSLPYQPAPEGTTDDAVKVTAKAAESGTVGFTARDRHVSAPSLFQDEPETTDDLTVIRGIGAKLQERLNRLGVYKLSQIGEWDDAAMDWIDIRLPGFKGRVHRDNWVNQARELGGAASRPTVRLPSDVLRGALANTSSPREMNFSAALSEEMRIRMPDRRVASFETETGFTLAGAKISRVATTRHPNPNGFAEIAVEKSQGNEIGVIRVDPKTSLVEIVVELEDGRCLFLPCLQGYIGHILMKPEGMASLSFVPSEYNWRAPEYAHRRVEIDRFRAAATLAMDRRSFFVGDAAKAGDLANMIRMGKAVDPVLGLYAAYAYSEASEDDQVLDVSRYMQRDIGGDLFDVRLLSHRRWYEDDSAPVAPRCPLLTQGWSILESRQAPLPPPIRDCRAFLADSLWTTFERGAAGILFDAISNGEL